MFHVCILRYFCPCISLRLKPLKHAPFNVYLASFLGSMDTFIRSIEAKLVVSYYLSWGRVFEVCFHG